MMKLGEIHKLAIELGIKSDPRGEEGVKKYLKKIKQDFDKMDKQSKEEFDSELLFNPYSDTRILYGDKNLDIKKVMAGWDIGVSEILLADRLNQKKEKIDLIISHHPLGKASATIHHVIHIEEAVLHNAGVPINIAEGLCSLRIPKVQRSNFSYNHEREVHAARILDIPLMCIHTAADNLVQKYIEDLIKKHKPSKVGELFDLIKSIPEYKMATENFNPPVILSGKESGSTGKIIVDMTAGVAMGKDIYPKLANFGVGTIVNMHTNEEELNAAMENYINIIMAGHSGSDSLGMNLFLDELEKKGIEILPCSGLLRYSRIK